MIVADKQIVKERFYRNFATYHCGAVVQKSVVDKFCKRLAENQLQVFNSVLEVGCGTGFLTNEFLEHFQVKQYLLNDLATDLYPEIVMNLFQKQFTNYTYLPGDAEQIDFPENLDAIISTSTVQWFKHFEKFIKKVNNHLTEHGLFAFSTFGQLNFKEIKQLLHLGLDYYTLNDFQNMLRPGFEILYAEQWQETMWFENPRVVLQHIKTTGVNGISKFAWSKSKLKEFETQYVTQFEVEGKVSLTYHPIIVLARKKAEF